MDSELLTTVIEVIMYGTVTVLCLYMILGLAHSLLIWLMGYGDD